MPTPGRSIEDLPLAAYSTGVDPESETFPDTESGAPPAGAAVGSVGTPDQVVAQAGPDDDKASATQRETPLRRARGFARRNPRPVAGALFVGMILVGLMLLSGGQPSPSAAGAVASATVPPAVTVAPDLGSATLTLTGPLDGSYALAGTVGQPVASDTVTASWADSLQDILTLEGPVDRGTRTTDAGLVLAFGLMVDGTLVTFTSKSGECTIGMAVNPRGVSGSFSCRNLKSDDGKLTVGANGTYRA